MYIVCDIGGTHTRVGFSSDLEILLDHKTFPTHLKGEEGLAHVSKVIHSYKLEFGDSIRGIVVGLPARITPDHVIHHSPHLPQWDGLRVAEMLQKEHGCPVYLENDSALCGLGEAQRGAGRGCYRVGYLTIGTGVGGALIVHGHIQQGAYNTEPGHMVILENGHPTTFDDYISGSALHRRTGQDPEHIHDNTITHEAEEYVSYALRNLTLVWSPDCLVLGGGIIMHDVYDVARIRELFVSHMSTAGHKPLYPELPVIRKAQLGDEMGLYGGMEYLRLTMKRVSHPE